MTDYEALVNEARKAQSAVYLAAPEPVAADLSRIIKGLADAVEALVAERDALRTQLDAMTVEKTTVPQFVTDKDTCDNRLDLLPRPRGHFEFPLMKRLVGPWVDAEGVSDGQQ